MGEPSEELTVAEAVARVHAAVHTLTAELRAAIEATVRTYGPMLAALAQLQQERGLVVDDEPACICICGKHRGADPAVTCNGTAQVLVHLRGGIVEAGPVAMCRACASWWQREQPHRVVAVLNVPEGELAGETAALERYQEALGRGLSDVEAREEGWPSDRVVPAGGSFTVTDEVRLSDE